MPTGSIINFQDRHCLISCFFNLFLILFFFLSIECYTQENEVISGVLPVITRTDSILGADDELVNGKIYIQEHLMAAGHPFFLSSEWYVGSITVNGNIFEDVFLKYNIYTDELILKAERYRGGTVVISLNNEFVDNFRLGDRYFVNSINFKVRGLQTDFVELLYHGNFDFFVSYVKLFNNNYNNKTPYGNYTKTLSSFYIFQGGLLVSVGSKKSLLDYFELYKKEIKKFMKKHKIKYGKASYKELSVLMQYCDKLTEEPVK